MLPEDRRGRRKPYPQIHLTPSVLKLFLQKSVLRQIRRLILYVGNSNVGKDKFMLARINLRICGGVDVCKTIVKALCAS